MAQPTNIELPPESWLVAVAPNKTVMLTLDEMDAAYQAGHIGEHTLVWTHGMSEWLPLDQAAAGDEEDDEAEDAALTPAWPQQVSPQQPASSRQQVSQQQVPQQQAPQSRVAEGARQNFARYDYAVAPAPSSPPMSTAPVAFNLDGLDELDDQVFAKKKQSKWGLLTAAAVVCGGVGFTLANAGGTGEETVVLAASQPPVAGQALAAAKDDAPLVLSTAAGYQVSPAERQAIEKQTEKEAAMKEKMAQALAGKETAPEPVRRSRGGSSFRKQEPAPPPKPSKGKAAGFDPLNGDLP